MRRPALLGLLCLALSGCGHLPFVAGPDPYRPAGESETMQRVEGAAPAVPALRPSPGNVWPGPVRAEPTLETLEQEQLTLPNQPAPPTLPAEGSSTPPGPALPPLPEIPPVPPVASAPPAPAAPPSAAFPVQGGMAVPTGGTNAYRTVTLPNGGTGIVVPNGNGTSTVIRSDGSVETIPTP
jgi:hypothetical protein